MPHSTDTYPCLSLAPRRKALGVSALGAATPPYKSLIYNALCSAGCFLAQIFFCLTPIREIRERQNPAMQANCKIIKL